MDVETMPQSRHVQLMKNHVDLSEDRQIKPLIEKYKKVKKYLPAIEQIEEEDVHALLKRYAEDVTMDLYTMAQAFNIHPVTLTHLLQSEQYSEEYEACRRARGEMVLQKGLEASIAPYEKVKSGEEVDVAQVNASKILGNYALAYARIMHKDWSMNVEHRTSSAPIQVVVNTGVKLGI